MANNDQILDSLKNIFNIFAQKYPSLRDVQVEVLPKDLKIKHCDLITYRDYVYKEKNRLKMVRPIKTIVWHNNDLERLIFTILHEVSHAITNYCERKKKSGLWIVTTENFTKTFLF